MNLNPRISINQWFYSKNRAKKLPKVVEELNDYSMDDSENEDVQKKKKKMKAGSKKHVTAR